MENAHQVPVLDPATNEASLKLVEEWMKRYGPEDLFDDPHVLREGGLVGAINADGAPFRVPALPVEWNGASIGDGLKVPVLGADTAAILSELEPAAKRAAGQA